MANKAPPRSILKMIFTNFLKSFRPRQIRGNYMGEDYFGNKYYEIPADPRTGKSKTSRWFDPPVKNTHDQEITAEWHAWLRGIRDKPPTKEELMQNLAMMEMKKRNAAKIDEKFAKPEDKLEPPKIVTGMSFPQYKEYEQVPGRSGEDKS